MIFPHPLSSPTRSVIQIYQFLDPASRRRLQALAGRQVRDDPAQRGHFPCLRYFFFICQYRGSRPEPDSLPPFFLINFAGYFLAA